MKRFVWSAPLLSLVLVVLAISLAIASTSQVTAVPDGIPINGVTSLQICRLTVPVDTIVSLTVTDPSGSVWTHAASAGVIIPKCPSTYNVNFGGASTGWVSDDGDTTQTDELVKYYVVIVYKDGSRGNDEFDCSAWFIIPEVPLGTIAVLLATFTSVLLKRKRIL